jgi:hypothetical protein
MDIPWRTIIWQQFGVAIDDLDNALRAFPDELWREGARPENCVVMEYLQ